VTVTDAHGCQSLGFGTVGTQCVSHITGTIFHDLNNNCVQDSGEGPINGTVIISGRSGTYYGTTYSGTSYSIDVTDTGTYTLSAVIYNNYCNSLVRCGSSSHTVTILHQGDSSTGNNFAFQGASGFDLALHPGWTSVSPGFTKEYWVMGFNQSPVAFTGAATIVFTYDSNLIYQSSYAPLPVHDPAAHTLTWQVAHLPSPNFDWNGRFRNFFTVPATMSPGYLMYSSFSISPTSGDCDSSNNVLTFSETCYGSHDPNDKKVEPSGAITESDSILTYTIDFQNTGTAATNFIIIKDTLSPNLDPASVVNIASSHPYSKFDISGRGILTWTFNPLALPDSLADPDGSKGFVKFTIRKKRDLAVGATISNTASIYFDYNGAVVTNTVADTLTNPLSIIERSSDPMVHVTAYPNPFSDMTTIVVSGLNESYGFELYDMTGRLVQSIPSMNVGEFKIHRDGMAGGVYLYRITTRTHQYAYGKLIAK
jgi:fimbrial isopeptide formation D2 family protein